MNSLQKALLILLTLLWLPLTLVDCGGSQTRATDIQQMGQRLQGDWVLEGYRPNVSLEAPLQGMLAAQLGQLRVTIGATEFHALGPGVDVVREFRIQEVIDQTATLIVSESSGVSVRVWVEVRGNTLEFRPMDAPWSGDGTLRRL